MSRTHRDTRRAHRKLIWNQVRSHYPINIHAFVQAQRSFWQEYDHLLQIKGLSHHARAWGGDQYPGRKRAWNRFKRHRAKLICHTREWHRWYQGWRGD